MRLWKRLVTLLVVAVGLMLSGCASTPALTSAHPWPGPGSDLPPIVLRASAARVNEHVRQPEDIRAANALRDNLLFGVIWALPTYGGSLILIPIGIVQSVSELSGRTNCPPRAEAALGDVPRWFASTFQSVPVLNIVSEELLRNLSGPPPAVLVMPVEPSVEKEEASLREAGQQLGASTLIITDVQIRFGRLVPSTCAIKLAVCADIRAQPLERPRAGQPNVSVDSAADDVPVEEWASDPTKAQRQLEQLLRQLAVKIAETYKKAAGLD
jgi:hypothetical protein